MIDKTLYTENSIEIIPVGRAKDLTQQTFGRLTVIGRAPINDRRAYWWCKCQCGKIVKIRGDLLLNQNTSSCGCYKKEVNSKQGKELAKKYNTINGKLNKKDLTNQIFGKLLVIEDTGKRKKIGNGTNVIWKCKCSCGNIIEVTGGHLTSGHTTSCGCRKLSKGEEKICKMLQDANISFAMEYIFTKEKLSTGGYPRFDFYIDDSYVVEYDGQQHFDCKHHGWNNQEEFIKIQLRDKEKNNICKKYNIPIIRIPYYHYDNLVLRDLIPSKNNEFLL